MLLRVPCTIETFEEMFPNEDACREFWDQHRWPLEFVCPRCGCTKGWMLAARGVTQCARKRCRYQVSGTAGTIFHKTRLPMRTWMRALVYYAERPLLTARALVSLLDVSLKTAGLMLRKIREAWRFYQEEYASMEDEPARQQTQEEAFDAKKLVEQFRQLAQQRKQAISDKFLRYLCTCVCAPTLRAILNLRTEGEQPIQMWQGEWDADFPPFPV